MDKSEEEHSLINHEADGEDEALQSETDNYEAALATCGTGRWTTLLLIICGWSVSSDAVEVLSISFILSPIKCELDISPFEQGLLNASIFAGMMVGGYFWGSLSDVHGRRAVLMWSLTLNGLSALGSSVAQSYWLFLVLRIVSGIGVGGSIPSIFSYFVEYLPRQARGAWVSALATFWMCGNILAAGLAWAVIPQQQLGISGHFQYGSWRIYIALCSFPALSSALIYVFMPESPKLLVKLRRVSEAEEVLRRVYRWNWRTAPPDTLLLGPSASDSLLIHARDQRRESLIVRIKITLAKMARGTSALFYPRLRRTTVVLIIIYFTLSFGYYGLWMWLPQLFQKIQENGGSVCKPHLGNTSANASQACTLPGQKVYFDGFMTALSNIPGNVFTILLMDRIGRRYMLAGGMVVSGLCVFFIALIETDTQNLIVSCVFGGISTLGWNALDVVVPELYPTQSRATAQGLMLVFARVAAISANLVFGLLVDVHCIVPLILVAALMTSGGLSALLLRETTNQVIG